MYQSLVFTFFITVLCYCGQSRAKSFDELVSMLEMSNHDQKIAQLKNEFIQNNISMAKSLYYPRLTSSWVANEGKDPDVINTSQLNSAISSSSPGVPGVPASQAAAGAQQISTDGWSGDVSLSYPLFNRFLSKTSVDNSRLDYQKDLIQLHMTRESKKIQLSQLLLEIHSLKRIQKTLSQGLTLLKKNKINNSLASTENRHKREEFEAEMEFNLERANMGLETTYMALRDLIPELSEKDFDQLPEIEVSYKLEGLEKIKKYYQNDSKELQQYKITERSFSNSYWQTKWERPYVPFVLLQGSYSQSAAFSQGGTSDTWRVSLLVTFNLFDGFYTQTRRAQAYKAETIARLRTSSEIAKNSILLTKSYYDIKVAKAEYRYKTAGLAKKKHRLQMIEKLSNSGVGTDMERTGLLLEVSRMEWEALDAKKKEQQAILFIAQKTDNLNGVKFNEIR